MLMNLATPAIAAGQLVSERVVWHNTITPCTNLHCLDALGPFSRSRDDGAACEY